MYGMINYYRVADNFSSVKGLIEGLRKSCVLTLARKHKKRPKWVYGVYGDNISITLPQGGEITLPTMESVGKLEPQFGLGQEAGLDLDKILSKFQYRSTLGWTKCTKHKDVDLFDIHQNSLANAPPTASGEWVAR
jgi:hypothetical protein